MVGPVRFELFTRDKVHGPCLVYDGEHVAAHLNRRSHRSMARRAARGGQSSPLNHRRAVRSLTPKCKAAWRTLRTPCSRTARGQGRKHDLALARVARIYGVIT